MIFSLIDNNMWYTRKFSDRIEFHARSCRVLYVLVVHQSCLEIIIMIFAWKRNGVQSLSVDWMQHLTAAAMHLFLSIYLFFENVLKTQTWSTVMNNLDKSNAIDIRFWKTQSLTSCVCACVRLFVVILIYSFVLYYAYCTTVLVIYSSFLLI